MLNTIRLAAVTAALGCVAATGGEASGQVFYGYPPAINVSPVYSPATSYGGYGGSGWSWSGYRHPGTRPAASWPVYYPAVNGAIPTYCYPSGTRVRPPVTQPVAPGAGFFSVPDPYLSSPGGGSSPPGGSGRTTPTRELPSPFYTLPVYTQPGTVVPTGGSAAPVTRPSGSYGVPNGSVPGNRIEPSPMRESPFYR